MRNIRNILSFLLLIILSFFFWTCSSDKHLDIVPKSPPAQTQKAPPPQETQTKEKAVYPEEKEQDISDFFPRNNIETEEKETEKADPSAFLEEALYAYQDAQLSWERGDFDTALTALDEAYSLILKLKLPADSPLFQEKNELRLMIAQRIQEIYASRLITVGNNHQSIPLVENKHVLNEINVFQTKEKAYFEKAFKRSGCFREMILEELKKAGLPEELSWMPIIESWFNVRAYSRARALGLWQFISSTGTRFGLKRDRYVDERMDPLKSTQAAIKYLSELHSFFGDWTTAIASYNCGEFKVQRVIRNQHINYLDNFWDLYLMLPRETARFVPRFIATLLIINNPEKYGFNLPTPDPPLRYETVTVNRPVRLSDLSKALGLQADELETLNPELRYKSTPNQEYPLKVPVGFGEKTRASLNSVQQYIPPEATYIIHYVRSGETLSKIAQRYGTTVTAIARFSGLRRIHLIRPGQRLKIPYHGRSYSPVRSYSLIKEGESSIYIVKRGDSLYRIANAFSTTVKKIKEDNELKSNILKIGQKLVIYSGRPAGATQYTVRAGDTPFDIARKFGMNLSNLLRINSLTIRSKIYPGQKLLVIPNK